MVTVKRCGYWTLFVVTCCISSAIASDILVVCPTASYSHQQPFLIISQALLQRNHTVTLLTCNPEKIKPHVNLTIVDLSFTYELWKNKKDLGLQGRYSQWKNLYTFSTVFSVLVTSEQWKHPNLRNFIDMIVTTNKTYDLMLFERVLYHSYLSLVDLVGQPPVIGMATAQYFSIISWPFNNPENPAYVPVIWTANTDSMTFWQRVTNTVQAMAYYWLHMRTLDKEQAILNQNLDEKYRKRSLREIYFDSAKDSFMFSFDSRITGYARPMQRKLVEVGPLHLVDPKPLDESLQKWMDGAPEGVIYFSLGTNMKGTSMGDFRRKAFLKAFARLPQYRVLWKWENDVMEGLGENIRLQKWMPQQDILAHPKVKLFIMQGGLQSLQEAFHYGVKLICIPMFADQDLNCQRVGKIKAGIVLEYEDLNEEIIFNALKLVLEDPQYEENMQYYSLLSKDTPMSPIEKSIWWIEYVLRHKGVAHLHSAAADLSYVQYYLLDVIAFIITILLVLVAAIYLLTKKVLDLVKSKLANPKEKERTRKKLK
ncbi:hypothetical protein M8J75_002109 [Diaphorina citri]|nr:hypothetical protein M8J75_002109 [Diaphorina citri]